MSEGIFCKNADLAQRLKDRIAFHANEHRHTYEIGKGVMDALALDLLADFRDRCPLCGGKIVVSDLYQTSHDFEVRRGGKVSRRYTVTDCGSMEVSVAGCADRCGAYWDADSFYIGADGKFYDQKYHEGGEDHDVP